MHIILDSIDTYFQSVKLECNSYINLKVLKYAPNN